MKIILTEQERIAVRDYALRIVDMMPEGEEKVNALMELFDEPVFDLAPANGGVISIDEKHSEQYILNPLKEANELLCGIKPEVLEVINTYNEFNDIEKIMFKDILGSIIQETIKNACTEMYEQFSSFCNISRKTKMLHFKAMMLCKKIKYMIDSKAQQIWHITKITVEK